MGSPDKPSSNARTMATCEGANQRFRELDRLRKEQLLIINRINKLHSSLSTTAPEKAEKISPDIWSKLRSFYIQAKTLAEEEASLLGSTVLQLDALIAPGGQQQQQAAPPHRKKPASSSSDPKRKRANSNANESPRLSSSPAIPPRTPAAQLNISVGDQVAARISPEDVENHEWIVVKVTRIDKEGNKFEVVDEEPDDDGEIGGRAYKLPISCIIPFPKKSDASNPPDFPQGSHVLAVYPGTTALYKASVVGPMRKKMKMDDHLLLEFDGDEEEGAEGLPQRPVPFHHIVTLPEGHRQ